MTITATRQRTPNRMKTKHQLIAHRVETEENSSTLKFSLEICPLDHTQQKSKLKIPYHKNHNCSLSYKIFPYSHAHFLPSKPCVTDILFSELFQASDLTTIADHNLLPTEITV